MQAQLEEPYDAAIVGGGPAGLSAALWLARYRRRVLVFDDGSARNLPTWALHGYPGLPDLPPTEYRKRLRDQALGAGAQLLPRAVVAAEGEKDAFRVRTAEGQTAAARRLLLAYGLRDRLPDVPGLLDAYGTSVFHCPDCDGPSITGTRVGVIGWRKAAAALALALMTWAEAPVLLTHGHDPDLDERTRATLDRYGIRILTEAIHGVDSRNGRVQSVELAGGTRLSLDALFFNLGCDPASDLGERLGCRPLPSGHLRIDSSRESTVPGVYAAGDLAGHPHLTITAAAEGVHAALAIHRSLLPDDMEL